MTNQQAGQPFNRHTYFCCMPLEEMMMEEDQMMALLEEMMALLEEMVVYRFTWLLGE